MKQLWSVVLMTLLTLVYADAEAARLGGGRSAGRQSANVTQREAIRAPAQAPNGAQNAANSASAAKSASAAGAANAATRKPWAGMLGGLAAGLGLAWLASAMGLGAEFGQFLLIALLVLVGVAVLRMIMRPRQAAGTGAPSPFAFQGAGGTPAAPDRMPGQYNPAKVGNDASARPWEDSRMAFDAAPAAGGARIGSALAGAQGWGVPTGFDVHGFLEAAKRNFTTLQSAWDRSDFAMLRSMMTDSMLDEVRVQLKEREQQRGGVQEPNHTEVLMLEAQLLGIEELDGEYMASVEFSGVIREETSAGPNPFREVWNMTKPKDGKSGWLVAGLQALQ